jgi:hypothetical protein
MFIAVQTSRQESFFLANGESAVAKKIDTDGRTPLKVAVMHLPFSCFISRPKGSFKLKEF